jgi:hypothetical protein
MKTAPPAMQADDDNQAAELRAPGTQLGGTLGSGEPEPEEQTRQHQQRSDCVLDDIATRGSALGRFDLAVHPTLAADATKVTG